jgi:hypothetical protein
MEKRERERDGKEREMEKREREMRKQKVLDKADKHKK